MLRPRRRPSSNYECSALPTFCEPLSSEVPHLDHSTSSCFEEDEDCPVIEEVKDFHPDYLKRTRKTNCSSLRATLARIVVVVCAFALVGCRLKTMISQNSDMTIFDAAADTAPLGASQGKPTSFSSLSLTDEQRRSQSQLYAKYGMGPHLVEFQLNIWGDDNRPVEHYFTIELAPSDLMPVTSYFFLEQVSKDLWSGTSFYENLEHVIVSRPVSGNGQISKRQTFVDTGLSRPAINEYSPDYPHTPYTLGFNVNAQGEPATFYINKKNNFHHHNTDACFAQVVVGRSTVDRLASMQGSPAGRIRPVEITQVRRVRLSDLSARAAQEYLLSKTNR